MKIPPETTRYCPYCKKHTLQVASVAKQKGRSSAHPMSRGSRAHLRGQGIGYGNKGRWGSKPPIKSWKRKIKATKRLAILYTCKVCKKTKGIRKAIRTSRLEVGEKIAK